MSDEVSAEDDEEAEQDEDDDGHHPSDHGVVHPRGRRHGCGVLRGGEERRVKGNASHNRRKGKEGRDERPGNEEERGEK